MDSDNRPIGFYDSGIGGISVLKEAVRLLPNENFIYFGDNLYAPYGLKDEKTVIERSFVCGDFLHGKGVKAIVIACNTATSIVVQGMRDKYSIPIISMEPAVKPAAEKYGSGKILVLATKATVNQKRYKALVERLDVGARVCSIECESLASLVEKGDFGSPAIKAYICEKLAPYRKGAIVIGCTHYSFIADKIKDVADKLLHGSCEIFDGRFGTAKHIVEVLDDNGISADSRGGGNVEFYSSKGDAFAGSMKRYLDL
jgi:glutamate racemase